MSISNSDVLSYLEMPEEELWEQLGKAVRSEGLGMLPEEEEQNPTDAQTGYWYYIRQLPNICLLYTSPSPRDRG